MIQKFKLKKMVQREVKYRKIKFKQMKEVQQNFKEADNIHKNASKGEPRSFNIPKYREYNLVKPHAIRGGSLSYLIQNPDRQILEKEMNRVNYPK